MKLILGSINNNHLREITENAARSTKEVWAAVAYATKEQLLFDWCGSNHIPLRFYGRLDHDIAVDVKILEKFLNSTFGHDVECYLVRWHHAKVIWWKGVGVYIGSANLTDNAWNKNIEAGCYFEDDEIDEETESDLIRFFDKLNHVATPLSSELVDMFKRKKQSAPPSDHQSSDFYQDPSINNWLGLNVVSSTKNQTKRNQQKELDSFLAEQRTVMDIAIETQRYFNDPTLYPSWVDKETPKAWHVDQFLNWFYQAKSFDESMSQIMKIQNLHMINRSRIKEATIEAVEEWQGLKESPQEQEELLKESMPYVHEKLSRDSIDQITEAGLSEILGRVNSSREYVKRASNKALDISDGSMRQEDRIEKLAETIFRYKTPADTDFKTTLKYLIYGPENIGFLLRLFECHTDPKYKIRNLGRSTLWEMAGYALPDKYPPINDRVRKALRGLGNDIRI